MKIPCIVFAILVMSAPSVSAIRTADPKELEAIQDQIYIANRMDKDIGVAQQKLENAKSPQERIYREQELAREKNKQNAARTKAIHMTILAYDLEPANRRGTSVVPLTKGRKIDWLPVARERESRHIQGPSGNSHHLEQPRKDLAGKVYPDGVAYIYPQAFEKGVGYLASTLLHERTHFEQITTPEKGDKMRRAESEVEALQAEKNNERYFYVPGIPADDAEMKATAALLDAETRAAEQVRKERATLPNKLRDLFGPSSQPDMFESKIHTNTELNDISGLVAQARAQVDIARRDREKREEIARESAAKVDHDERLRRIYVGLARRSCANPGSVTQAELNALPDPHDEDFVSSAPERLDECAFLVYKSLGRGVDAERIRQRSTPAMPVDPQGAPPETRPIHANPQQRPAQVGASRNFWSSFGGLKKLALAACASPAQASLETHSIQPTIPYTFDRDWDDGVAARLSEDLGECPRKLFYELIEKIRSGSGGTIDDQWLRDRASYHSTPAYVPPPSGGDDPCRDNGNIRCP